MKVTRLGFLVSGQGSNMQAIIDACMTGDLHAEPAVVISNNAYSNALNIAKSRQIPSYHLSSNTHKAPALLDRTITETMNQHKVSLVILAGYMKRVGPVLLTVYRNRVINIHPSLLPKYGGKGMYGINVHRAVIESGDKETGVTIHLVNDEYDEGFILAQHKISVNKTDTPESLAIRVLEVEHTLYLDVLKKIIDGKIVLP
jgi:phosphoribosylglycinamide formyltransferase 1